MTEAWGRRVDDYNLFFEVMCLHIFQTGHNWRMVQARHDAFQKAIDANTVRRALLSR